MRRHAFAPCPQCEIPKEMHCSGTWFHFQLVAKFNSCVCFLLDKCRPAYETMKLREARRSARGQGQITFEFSPKKSAQAAAVLLGLNGGDMDKYLFIKMLYLADRKALEKWEEPITGDTVAMMQYGPVLSTIYDLTKGKAFSCRDYWQNYISDSDDETNIVALVGDPGSSELSDAEIAILERVHAKFRTYDWRRMRDYCHDLPEFEEIGQTSKMLPTERILEAIGFSESKIEGAKKRFQQIKIAEKLFA